jgi:hypothetical protein
MLNAIMLTVTNKPFILSVVMHNVIMLSVVILSVVAPHLHNRGRIYKTSFLYNLQIGLISLGVSLAGPSSLL